MPEALTSSSTNPNTTKNTTRDDRELLELLTKLYTIQEDVGSKTTKTTLIEKRNKAGNIMAMQGKGNVGKKVGTKFIEVKSSIVDRLRSIHHLISDEEKIMNGTTFGSFTSTVAGGNNPRDAIKRKATIREEIKKVESEWIELNQLYKAEAGKRKSRFTKEQLDTQQTLVQRLFAEVQKLKDMQSMEYARSDRDDVAASFNTQAFNNVDFNVGNNNNYAGSSFSGGVGGGVEMTENQALRLQQIEKRDREFDHELDELAGALDDLHDIAERQQEEVLRQNLMIDNIGQRIENVNEHLGNVNSKMKETLKEVRSGEKICVDIMCIVLMVGLGAVLYRLIK